MTIETEIQQLVKELSVAHICADGKLFIAYMAENGVTFDQVHDNRDCVRFGFLVWLRAKRRAYT